MEDRDKQDILDAIALLAEKMEEGFTEVNRRLSDHDQRFLSHDQYFASLDRDMRSIKSQMVTKSYLDDKIGELRAELVLLSRKSNTKLSQTIEELVASGSLKRETADRLLALEPFPQ